MLCLLGEKGCIYRLPEVLSPQITNSQSVTFAEDRILTNY